MVVMVGWSNRSNRVALVRGVCVYVVMVVWYV